MPEYQVTERHYSWGSLVQLLRHGRLVMAVDVYRNGTFAFFPVTSQEAGHV